MSYSNNVIIENKKNIEDNQYSWRKRKKREERKKNKRLGMIINNDIIFINNDVMGRQY